MICCNCKIDKLITDFLNNSIICYKCVYRKKLEKTTEKQIPKPSICRTCGKGIVQLKSHKKRQRTVFCSQDCAIKGHKEMVKNHWTRKLRAANTWKPGGEGKWNFNQK